ncbi:LemA family protein [Paucibacter sp. APW11]|uniref:LemA family protein n=1 Tax=Roseateles aquae TaxID=3077235 RepID=A0ABU3PAL3_9BURK|nr:LemA family protein [Paucibacter sp. APW11]MDT8999557.1 LemA family protein [Paucibacter sp. APW11]
MTDWSWVGWGLMAVLLFWSIGAYNRVMQLRNAIGTAYAQLDEALGQRATQSARLIALARPVMLSEQATFDALETAQAEAHAAAQAVRARPHAADPVATLAVAAAVHGAALTRLMSLVEHHGELREQAEVDALIDELKLIERHRAFARQVFNQAVTAYNEAVQQFPTRVLCSFFGFTEARSL